MSDRIIHHTEFAQRIDSEAAYSELMEFIEPMIDAGIEDAVQFTRLPKLGTEVYLPTEGLYGRVVSLSRLPTRTHGGVSDWRVEIDGMGFFKREELGFFR